VREGMPAQAITVIGMGEKDLRARPATLCASCGTASSRSSFSKSRRLVAKMAGCLTRPFFLWGVHLETGLLNYPQEAGRTRMCGCRDLSYFNDFVVLERSSGADVARKRQSGIVAVRPHSP
jgi:hypothetical protein